MPMMAIAKKDEAICTVDDFCELNKSIVRRKYPLPKIHDIFHCRKGYTYATFVDLTLCYYMYELEEESTWYCIIVTLFAYGYPWALVSHPTGPSPS